jgi:hypothetical protein
MLCVRLRRLLAAAYGVGPGSELLGNDERHGRPRLYYVKNFLRYPFLYNVMNQAVETWNALS